MSEFRNNNHFKKYVILYFFRETFIFTFTCILECTSTTVLNFLEFNKESFS